MEEKPPPKAPKAKVKDKLTHAQHLDEASWSTRTWTTLQCQRLSVVLHTACAWEITEELCRAVPRAPCLGDYVAAA